MKRMSLEPDEHLRWVYDTSHRDYDSEEAKILRRLRADALASCPEWAISEALENDRQRAQDIGGTLL